MEALVASAQAKEDVSLGKIEVTNTEQSKESGTTQILILSCTLEYAAICSSWSMQLSAEVVCLAPLKKSGGPKDEQMRGNTQ